MEPIRAYEYLCKARHKLFDWLRPLTDEQYRREFPFAMKRLSATLPHMMLAEWAYAWRIERGERVDWTKGPTPRDAEPPLAEVELHWRTQAMAMLRMLGVAAQDLDYSLVMYVAWEQFRESGATGRL